MVALILSLVFSMVFPLTEGDARGFYIVGRSLRMFVYFRSL